MCYKFQEIRITQSLEIHNNVLRVINKQTSFINFSAFQYITANQVIKHGALSAIWHLLYGRLVILLFSLNVINKKSLVFLR